MRPGRIKGEATRGSPVASVTIDGHRFVLTTWDLDELAELATDLVRTCRSHGTFVDLRRGGEETEDG